MLVPAALDHAIHEGNAADVRASVVAEAANVPCTPEARDVLGDRGVVVIPDFVANGGANAWWWWTMRGEIDGSVAASFAIITERMRGVVADSFALAEREGIAVHRAAERVAEANLAALG